MDTLIGGIFPTFACLFVLKNKMHIMTMGGWLLFKTLALVEDHSGIELPFSMFNVLPFASSMSDHYHHHLNNDGNYGSFLKIWDALFGTLKGGDS
jgi:sterol desaturase/sphingolipid hydroxylase (fatty acid hydroxylase superfamily)